MLPVIKAGTNTCSTCDTPVGNYVTAALTDSTGTFTLKGVPTGSNLPLVIQIGKWRRILTVPSVADCKTTTLPSTGTTSSAFRRTSRKADMPQMA